MKVGRTRIKLAELLSEALPDLAIFADELHSQPAAYLAMEAGHARWYTTPKYKTGGDACVSVCSWDTMTECVKMGINVNRKTPGTIDVSAKE